MLLRVATVLLMCAASFPNTTAFPISPTSQIVGAASAPIVLTSFATMIDVAEAQRRFVEANVWIRPFGKLVYLMPPFIIGPNDVTALTDAVGLILD